MATRSPRKLAPLPAKAPKAVKPARTTAAEAPSPARDLQIGARLKHARLLAGVRMRELADKVGCTEGMVSKIENARVVPSLPMLQRLVEALGRDLPSFSIFETMPSVQPTLSANSRMRTPASRRACLSRAPICRSRAGDAASAAVALAGLTALGVLTGRGASLRCAGRHRP